MVITKVTTPTPQRSGRRTPQPWRAVLACAICICLAATTGFASEYRYAVDQHPKRVGADLWRFVIHVGVRPVGEVQFVSCQFDFASPTEGIEVDYDFNGAGVDFSDGRAFYVIAPTLFDQIGGLTNGWDIIDIDDGTFSGVVRATAQPIMVEFGIEADSFVPIRYAPFVARRQLLR